jgi:hypothetical protein
VIARRIIFFDDALSVLVPVLEDIVGYDALQVWAVFEGQGLQIQEWDKVRTDILTIRDARVAAGAGPGQPDAGSRLAAAISAPSA